ncbi:DUF397 domain-containing protein [Nocardiopsis sp. NPDC006832]|uniref:DUF397 domain-containing protein n=1 Tax=Nocardiopsis sp. NPDC006832 TaxID=3157188 RepID=UPI0033CFA70A
MTGWFKSSYSQSEAACAEVAHNPWRKSSYSAERGECVEVAEGPTTGIRDTQNRKHGALFFAADEWQAFLGIAKGA